MRRPTRTLLIAVSAALLGAGPAAGQVPRLAWEDCDDGFECATAVVPLDHDGPSRRTIDLALVRLPATDPARRIGSLFVNPGGPGGSGVEAVREGGKELSTPDVRARFDIVGMDPRGVGGSTPVRCFATRARSASRPAAPSSPPPPPRSARAARAASS